MQKSGAITEAEPLGDIKQSLGLGALGHLVVVDSVVEKVDEGFGYLATAHDVVEPAFGADERVLEVAAAGIDARTQIFGVREVGRESLGHGLERLVAELRKSLAELRCAHYAVKGGEILANRHTHLLEHMGGEIPCAGAEHRLAGHEMEVVTGMA